MCSCWHFLNYTDRSQFHWAMMARANAKATRRCTHWIWTHDQQRKQRTAAQRSNPRLLDVVCLLLMYWIFYFASRLYQTESQMRWTLSTIQFALDFISSRLLSHFSLFVFSLFLAYFLTYHRIESDGRKYSIYLESSRKTKAIFKAWNIYTPFTLCLYVCV